MSEKVDVKVVAGKTGKTKPNGKKKAKKVVAIALSGSAPPQRKLRKVKAPPGFSQVSKFKNIGFRSNGRDTPEEFRAKLMALAQKFPMMMPQTIGDGGSTESFLDLPVAAMSSLNRFPAVFHTVTTPVAGNYFYAFVGMIGGGYLHSPIFAASSMDGSIDGTFNAFTESDDNLYSLVSTFLQSSQCTARCVRAMNATPLLTAGGEVLMGTIPSSLVTSGLTWSQLYNYIDVQQVDLPLAQDVCFGWMPGCVSDFLSVSPINVAAFTSNSYSMLFVAVRVPWGSSSPAMDFEFYSNYTVTAMPNYEKVIQAKVQPVDDKAFIAAKRTIGLTNTSSRKIEPTSSVGYLFKEAAAALGPSVVKWVTGKAKTWMNSASDFVSGLFGTRVLHQLMVLQGQDRKRVLEQISLLEEEKILPLSLTKPLREFLSFDIRFTNTAIEVSRPDLPTYVAERMVESGPFDTIRSVRISSRQKVLERHVEEKEDFIQLTPPSARSHSVPRSKI